MSKLGKYLSTTTNDICIFSLVKYSFVLVNKQLIYLNKLRLLHKRIPHHVYSNIITAVAKLLVYLALLVFPLNAIVCSASFRAANIPYYSLDAGMGTILRHHLIDNATSTASTLFSADVLFQD